MARAKRYYLPGLIWHITHRCHKREFLLKFPRDRRRWLYWLFLAKKRFNLRILGYTVTSNHIHLLMWDSHSAKSGHVIPCALHLAASRIAQEYNQRKRRRGAFWEDRYHATAVESGSHLLRCLLYLDLNMVRAGVVSHPRDWLHGGYSELCRGKKRYVLIDRPSLVELTGFSDFDDFWSSYNVWLAEALEKEELSRESRWTESVAVGSGEYLEKISKRLGVKLRSRKIIDDKGMFVIREEISCWKSFRRPIIREN